MRNPFIFFAKAFRGQKPRASRRPRGARWKATQTLWNVVCAHGYSTAVGAAAAEADTVRKALASGADALCSHGVRDEEMSPTLNALMAAAARDRPECVKALMPAIDPNMIDAHTGWTALMFAGACGHSACVNILAPLSNPSHRDFKGRSALQIALHNVQAHLSTSIPRWDETLLELAKHHHSDTNEWREIAELAVARRAHPLLAEALRHCDARDLQVKTKATDHQPEPALNMAARSGEPRLVQCLLAAGADPLARGGPKNLSPLECATMAGHPRDAREACAKILWPAVVAAKDPSIARGALLMAIENQDEDMARLFLGGPNPINLNFFDPDGQTALHVALETKTKNAKILNLLVDSGADCRIKNAAGHTALELALSAQNWECADVLMASMSNAEAARLLGMAGATLFPRASRKAEARAIEIESGLEGGPRERLGTAIGTANASQSATSRRL